MKKTTKKYSYYLIGLSLVIFARCHCFDAYLGERPTSEPYLSGDTFRSFCDHFYDMKNTILDPLDIKKGDIVFVCSDPTYLVPFFREIHPFIKEQYILLTHNSDENITEKYKKYMDDPKIFIWFSQNVAYVHPKLIPIPIGLENKLWRHNYDRMITSLRENGADKQEKKYFVFLNYSVNTNLTERLAAYNYFSQQPFCYCAPRQSNSAYLADICKAQFIVSPHGNGRDCHRTWEALYLNVIPIVKASELDPLYENLPVLIVQKWEDATSQLLQETYARMQQAPFAREKLYSAYWKKYLKETQELCKTTGEFFANKSFRSSVRAEGEPSERLEA